MIIHMTGRRIGRLQFFENLGSFSVGWDRSQEVIKIFEPFLYCKKSMEILLNFWPIGAGSLKWGRLAGFL